MKKKSKKLSAALRYAGRGWPVFPVHSVKDDVCSCGRKLCRDPGKHPRTRNGFKDATTDEAEIKALWDQWPTANIGIATGSVSGLLVLDTDPRNGSDESLKKIKGGSDLPETPTVVTGGDDGGRHFYMEYPPDCEIKSRTDILAGLDVKAEGGYVIAPPSLHESGRKYLWEYGLTPGKLKLARVPLWLKKLLAKGKPRQPSAGRDDRKSIPEGQRHDSLLRVAGSLRRVGATREDIEATLLSMNGRRCDPPLPENEVQTIARSAEDWEPGNGSPPYFATDAGLFWRKPGKDGETIVQLTNFGAQIIGDVVTDDGVETQRRFGITAFLNGRETKVTIAARDFPVMNWVYEMLGPGAVMFAGAGVKDHCRTAIQLVSPKIVKSQVFTHTGWRKLGDKWYYLHDGGAIGEGGLYEAKVILPPDLSFFNLPEPPRGEALEEAVRASLSILKLGPRRITVPFYCAIWRSVIGTCDFSIHYAGPTGTFKTSLSALGQQHFGRGFDRLHPPASWESTENALQALQFFAKDTILLIDDFAPRGNKSDIERYHHKADRVLRGQGNNVGRARMKPDSSLRATKSARGTTLSTGEDVPKGESLKARLMILELERDTIDEARLQSCQEQGSAGLYCQAMAGFLGWLAPRYESIASKLPAKVAAWREKAARSDQHRRTPEMVANLMYGLSIFLRFCSGCNILSEEEIEKLRSDAWEALGLAAAAQAKEQRADEPARRFLDLLSAALASGEAQLKDARNGNPSRESSGRCVGWIDGEYVLLEPDASFAEAQRMASQQGEALPVAKNTLWKRLREKRLIARWEKGRNLVKWTIRGAERRVVCLSASILPISASFLAAK